MSAIFFGIDPGTSGAIAVINPDAGIAHVWPMPYSAKAYDLDRIRQLLECDEDEKPIALIEKVHSSPQMGVVSAFSFGKGYGILIGMLGALGIPHDEVPPRKWQDEVLHGEDRSDTKAASVRVARRLFPHVSLRPTPRCKTDDHNMSDALLIAEYARRTRK